MTERARPAEAEKVSALAMVEELERRAGGRTSRRLTGSWGGRCSAQRNRVSRGGPRRRGSRRGTIGAGKIDRVSVDRTFGMLEGSSRGPLRGLGGRSSDPRYAEGSQFLLKQEVEFAMCIHTALIGQGPTRAIHSPLPDYGNYKYIKVEKVSRQFPFLGKSEGLGTPFARLVASNSSPQGFSP